MQENRSGIHAITVNCQEEKKLGRADIRTELNLMALECMSAVLTQNPRIIELQSVREVMACGVSEQEAMVQLLMAALGLDARADEMHGLLERQYFRPSLKRLEASDYRQNPYSRLIRFPEAGQGRWTMTHMAYAPYELFVRDDLLVLPDGREIPQMGYFAELFDYPAVLQDGREWMTITPNEIATMQPAIDEIHGHVAVMGLGLGYFALMASEKDCVSQVTVIERDKDAIALFRQHILPQFPHAQKIRIICTDAFEYAKDSLGRLGADFAFVDLWHDVSDGAPMYIRMKALERFAPGTKFLYWIETSIQAFLRNLYQ